MKQIQFLKSNLYRKEGIKSATEKTVVVPSKLKRKYYALRRWALDIARKILKKGY